MEIEDTVQKEQVIVVINKIAPSDKRCLAQVSGGKRCKKEIFFDAPLNNWSKLCEKHHKQNEDYRINKAKMVVIFSGGDE